MLLHPTMFGRAVVPTTLDPSKKTSGISLSGLVVGCTTTAINENVAAVYGASHGKKYFEVLKGNSTAVNDYIGISNWAGAVTSTNPMVQDANGLAVSWSGNMQLGSSTLATGLGSNASGTYTGVAVDLDAMLVWFRHIVSGVAGNWNADASANPTAGVGGLSFSAMPAGTKYPTMTTANSGSSYTFNFGASAYAAAAPGGFDNWGT